MTKNEFLKSEFCKLVGLTETYITEERYSCIEEAYMNTDESEQEFCKRLCKEYRKLVIKPTEMLVNAKTTAEKEAYAFCGDKSIMRDVENIKEALMTAFFKTFK